MALPFGFTPLEVQTYLILTVCWVSIVIVNLLEQPYARSLVACDTPVNNTAGAEFSGSNLCGNRLYVIDQGAEISGKGQSLENVGRIAITLFVSGFADYGRKRAAVLGQFLILMSTVLFAIAKFSGGFSMQLYIIAQGLQGMSGIGILDSIVTGDVALQVGDTVAVYGRKNLFQGVLMVVLMPMVIYVQYAEFTDFTWVWAGIVALNSCALALLAFVFPETLQKKPDEDSLSVVGIVKKEINGFRELITSNPYMGGRLLEELCTKMADAGSIGMPFLMATFGFSQIHALFSVHIPMMVGGLLFMPLIPKLCKAIGHRKVWNSCYLYWRLTTILFCFLQPMTVFGMPFPLVGSACHLPLSGWVMTVIPAVEIRLIGQEKNAKYQAMSQLIGFLAGSITSYMYSAVFNAEATTYMQRIVPFIISAACHMAALPFYLYITGPVQRAECDKLDSEPEATATEEESKKTD